MGGAASAWIGQFSRGGRLEEAFNLEYLGKRQLAWLIYSMTSRFVLTNLLCPHVTKPNNIAKYASQRDASPACRSHITEAARSHTAPSMRIPKAPRHILPHFTSSRLFPPRLHTTTPMSDPPRTGKVTVTLSTRHHHSTATLPTVARLQQGTATMDHIRITMLHPNKADPLTSSKNPTLHRAQRPQRSTAPQRAT